jgi:hypothetical protein
MKHGMGKIKLLAAVVCFGLWQLPKQKKGTVLSLFLPLINN